MLMCARLGPWLNLQERPEHSSEMKWGAADKCVKMMEHIQNFRGVATIITTLWQGLDFREWFKVLASESRPTVCRLFRSRNHSGAFGRRVRTLALHADRRICVFVCLMCMQLARATFASYSREYRHALESAHHQVQDDNKVCELAVCLLRNGAASVWRRRAQQWLLSVGQPVLSAIPGGTPVAAPSSVQAPPVAAPSPVQCIQSSRRPCALRRSV